MQQQQQQQQEIERQWQPSMMYLSVSGQSIDAPDLERFTDEAVVDIDSLPSTDQHMEEQQRSSGLQ
jgi:hypothetical protein